MECENRCKFPSFKQFCHGLLRCSFFALDGDLGMPVVTPVSFNAVVISVISQPMSNQVISDELSEWGLEGWDWQINQISEREYVVTFPAKECLKMMASCSSFALPLNQVMVFVKATVDGAKVVASLSQTWVLLDDVPSGLHNARFLMAFGGLVGNPV